MLSYCLQTVNASVDAKKPGGHSPGDERLSTSLQPALSGSPRLRGWKEDEVVVCLFRASTLTSQANQLASEESVEAIVRKRTLDGEHSHSDLDPALLMISLQNKMPVFLSDRWHAITRLVGPSRQWQTRSRSRAGVICPYRDPVLAPLYQYHMHHDAHLAHWTQASH